jgi:hypothetical protein
MLRLPLCVADTLRSTGERVIYSRIRVACVDFVPTLQVFIVSPRPLRWIDARDLVSWSRR